MLQVEPLGLDNKWKAGGASWGRLISRSDSSCTKLSFIRAVPDIEYTALIQLQEAEQKMAKKGVSLRVAGLNRRALESIRRTSLGERLQQGRLFASVSEAVDSYSNKRANSPPPAP